MRASQTSSSLASKVLNFWVLLLDQVIVILLSMVNFVSEFLGDNEWFKFGVVMTSCHYVILYVFSSQKGVRKKTYAAKRAEKLKKTQRMKTCHDLIQT
jgi:membrane protein YdbS with pleckstrin-like domain